MPRVPCYRPPLGQHDGDSSCDLRDRLLLAEVQVYSEWRSVIEGAFCVPGPHAGSPTIFSRHVSLAPPGWDSFPDSPCFHDLGRLGRTGWEFHSRPSPGRFHWRYCYFGGSSRRGPVTGQCDLDLDPLQAPHWYLLSLPFPPCPQKEVTLQGPQLRGDTEFHLL